MIKYGYEVTQDDELILSSGDKYFDTYDLAYESAKEAIDDYKKDEIVIVLNFGSDEDEDDDEEYQITIIEKNIEE